MSDRKEYLKKYRLEHKEKYKEYQRKYSKTHLSTYELLKKENQELKKQLEEYDRKLFFTKNELDMRQKSIDNKLNQQKEFIEYLTSYIELLSNKPDLIEESEIELLKEILAKYQEIIGVSNENI